MRFLALALALSSCADNAPRLRFFSSTPIGANWSFVLEDHARSAQLLIDGRPRGAGCTRAGVHIRCELAGLFPGGHTVELALAGGTLRRSALVGTPWPLHPILVRAHSTSDISSAALHGADAVLLRADADVNALSKQVELAHKHGLFAVLESPTASRTLIERCAADGVLNAEIDAETRRRFPQVHALFTAPLESSADRVLDMRGSLGLGLALETGRAAIVDDTAFPLLELRRKHKALRDGKIATLRDGDRHSVRFSAGREAITLYINGSNTAWKPLADTSAHDLLATESAVLTVEPGHVAATQDSVAQDHSQY